MFSIDKETSLLSIIFGIGIFSLGIIFFFERGLMISGNILILFGIGNLFKTKPSFFLSKERIYGSFLLFLGIFLLIKNWFLIGFFVELIGLFLIFKNSLPSIKKLIFRFLTGSLFTSDNK